mmetsp:Transcript_1433/g.5703  ORF Transcript_1433/g.5703 Transcript_1433/m.5703 type:complete len:342 (-) Transcript_1433:451-1476(-)
MAPHPYLHSWPTRWAGKAGGDSAFLSPPPSPLGFLLIEPLRGGKHARGAEQAHGVEQQPHHLERENAKPHAHQLGHPTGEEPPEAHEHGDKVDAVGAHEVAVVPPREQHPLGGHGARVHEEAGAHHGHDAPNGEDHRRAAREEGGREEQDRRREGAVGRAHHRARRHDALAQAHGVRLRAPDGGGEEGLACLGDRVPKDGEEDEDTEGNVVGARAHRAEPRRRGVEDRVDEHLGEQHHRHGPRELEQADHHVGGGDPGVQLHDPPRGGGPLAIRLGPPQVIEEHPPRAELGEGGGSRGAGDAPLEHHAEEHVPRQVDGRRDRDRQQRGHRVPGCEEECLHD